MQTNDDVSELLDFIEKSPSCFHAVENFCRELEGCGFVQLREEEPWTLEYGKKYFVTRNSSAIISFVLPEKSYKSFLICASHSDSPTFKVKENPEISCDGNVTKLNVEKYGGMLCAPWFDRPLSIAGRILCREKAEGSRIALRQRLVAVDRDLVMIPSLAIHMNRDANDSLSFNVQNDMLPLFSLGKEPSLKELVAQSAGVAAEDIVSSDLFLYNRVPGTVWGANNEFLACAKLDDLECAWTSFKAFVGSDAKTEAVKVHCVFDNEEVGSQTRQGAAGTFLAQTLERINSSLGRSAEEHFCALAKSFMVSADNAHAVHPNFAAKADPVNRPQINGGPVIKFNAAQKYTTDGISAAVFMEVCKRAGVPYQIFTNRSDMAGGSTLGNISGTQVSINCVDIGIAQWAMHSPYESGGTMDVGYMTKALKEFYDMEWNLL